MDTEIKPEFKIDKVEFTAKLTTKQKTIVEFVRKEQPRIVLLEGAVRSGKSYLNNLLWLEHIQKFKNKKFIISGNTLGSVKRNVLDDIAEITGGKIRLSSKNEFKLFDNTMICFGGGFSDSYKSLKGFTAHGWYANEVTEHNQDFVNQAFARCSGEGAKIFWDTNPSSPTNFIKQNYVDKSGKLIYSNNFSEGRINVQSWHFTLDDNNFLDAEYIASIKESIPRDSVWYKRNILGLWVAVEGIIYSHYKISEYVISNIISGVDQWVGGVDFGKGGEGYFAFVMMARIGKIYIIVDEAYLNKCLNTEFITVVEDMLNYYHPDLKQEIEIYGDSADPAAIREWSNAGFRIDKAYKKPYSVISGIEMVKQHPLIIHPRCKNTISEIQNYHWKKSDNEDEIRPIKYNDHLMDAMRYGIYTNELTGRGVKDEQGVELFNVPRQR